VLRTAVLAIALLAAAATPAAAQDVPADTPTPDGPATLRGLWNGPVATICHGDRAVVAFTLRVGEGSRPGRVRLRIVRERDGAWTGVRSGPWVELPAAPGEHRFPASLHLGHCGTGDSVALDQETGGHTIVHTHPPGDGDPTSDRSKLHELAVFQPPLADGASATPSERRAGQELLMRVELEGDADRDGLGDATQDADVPPPGTGGSLTPPQRPQEPQPALRMRAERAAGRAVRVTVTTARAGVVTVVARLRGGIRLRRTLAFDAAGTREALLRVPRRALRGRRRAVATVVARLPGADPVRRRVAVSR
jgi:hypothetical protein